MLRRTRPLLLDAFRDGAAASGALPGQMGSITTKADGGATTTQSATTTGAQRQNRPFRPQNHLRKPLSDRYDIGGYPHPPLNTKYSSLVVGEHFGRIVFDRRSEMMAILSATNLIRETIAGEGRILITSHDRRLEGEILACARDCGEFTHSGKWPPGGFTNRPQVSVVPKLPSLVIALEHDNHVLMREAFQMCIPRVAPVNVLNNKADFTPEVPLHAAEYTLHEKKRMLQFFTSFIAKLKFGQMPVGDTQSRYKEFANKIISTHAGAHRDIPEPYLQAARRPHDSRPDLRYGVQPAHVEYNAQRALEESKNYHIAALQPSSYLDAAASPDDLIARDKPSIDSYDIGDTVEYSQLSEKYAPSIDATNGGYVTDYETGRLVPSANARDYEHEELMADERARRESGVRMERPWNEFAGNSESTRRAKQLDRSLSRMPDSELRELYEQWYKDRQDAANDFIPYADETEPPLQSKFTQPSEKQAQERLWKLKARVRENQAGRNEKTKLKKTNAKLARGNAPKPITSFVVQAPFAGTGMKFSTLAFGSGRSFSTTASQPTPKSDAAAAPITPAAAVPAAESTAAAADATTTSAAAATPSESDATAASDPTASSSSVAPAAAAAASEKSQEGASKVKETGFKWKFPRALLPAFLFVPIAAYFASLAHSDDETREKVLADQKLALEMAAKKIGLATTATATAAVHQPVTPTPPVTSRAALESSLRTAETNLTLLLEARAFVLSSIPEKERHEHKAILEEVEEKKKELEQEIVELKNKLGKK